jgi:hypothetical protein
MFGTACDFALITSNVSKRQPSSYIFNQRGTTVMFLVKNYLVEKGVRQCIVTLQQPVLLSPNFGTKSSHFFMQQHAELTVLPATMTYV